MSLPLAITFTHTNPPVHPHLHVHHTTPSQILILLGRAANIFPLSFLVNRFRTTKISSQMQFIMWFSGETCVTRMCSVCVCVCVWVGVWVWVCGCVGVGVGVGWCGWSLVSFSFHPLGLRGAIAYALALNLSERGESFGSAELIRVLDTTTLIVVLFTIICFGGSTLPLLKVGPGSDTVLVSYQWATVLVPV